MDIYSLHILQRHLFAWSCSSISKHYAINTLTFPENSIDISCEGFSLEMKFQILFPGKEIVNLSSAVLTHFRLNELFHTKYWKILISI